MRRHEWGLEIAVILLLGVGGAAIAIAVYEAQSNHSAALWWSFATAAFIAAFLIPAVWFGVHPLFVWGSQWSAQWRARAATLRVERTARSASLAAAPLTILSASYAGPNASADVTEIIRRLVEDSRRLAFTANNETMQGDPEVGVGKTLVIRYVLHGVDRADSFPEGAQVEIG